MNVLLLGDRFITVDTLEDVFLDVFRNVTGYVGEDFSFRSFTDNWPVDPVEHNDEVSEFCGSDDDIVPLMGDVDILITHTGCITKKVLDAAPKLRVIGAVRGGPVNINVPECTKRGIPVVYAPGRNSGAVAEYTVGMMIAATRNIVFCHDSFFNHKRWRGDMYAYEYISDELGASTIGLFGFGAVGGRVCRALNAFGSRVIAYDPYISEDVKAAADCEFVTVEKLLAESDIISLHARYTKETKNFFNRETFGMMKEGAVFINTARGEMVDHEAMYEALKSKRLRFAALDVYEGEPPGGDSQLFCLDNVVACTHLAGASKQAAIIGARRGIEGVRAFLMGETPPYCANPEALLPDAVHSGAD